MRLTPQVAKSVSSGFPYNLLIIVFSRTMPATPLTKKAINIAKYNAKMHQLTNRIKFYKTSVDNFFKGKYDLIISNPPYINKFYLKYLEKDVFDYEPELALDGGKTGFSKISKVVCRASGLIKKNGKLILEIGFDQKSKVIEILNVLEDKVFLTNLIKS